MNLKHTAKDPAPSIPETATVTGIPIGAIDTDVLEVPRVDHATNGAAAAHLVDVHGHQAIEVVLDRLMSDEDCEVLHVVLLNPQNEKT